MRPCQCQVVTTRGGTCCLVSQFQKVLRNVYHKVPPAMILQMMRDVKLLGYLHNYYQSLELSDSHLVVICALSFGPAIIIHSSSAECSGFVDTVVWTVWHLAPCNYVLVCTSMALICAGIFLAFVVEMGAQTRLGMAGCIRKLFNVDQAEPEVAFQNYFFANL